MTTAYLSYLQDTVIHTLATVNIQGLLFGRLSPFELTDSNGSKQESALNSAWYETRAVCKSMEQEIDKPIMLHTYAADCPSNPVHYWSQ